MTDNNLLNELIKSQEGNILTVDIADNNSTDGVKYRVTAQGEESFVTSNMKQINEDGTQFKKQDEDKNEEDIDDDGPKLDSDWGNDFDVPDIQTKDEL